MVKQWHKNVALVTFLIAVTVAVGLLAFSFEPDSSAEAASVQGEGADSVSPAALTETVTGESLVGPA